MRAAPLVLRIPCTLGTCSGLQLRAQCGSLCPCSRRVRGSRRVLRGSRSVLRVLGRRVLRGSRRVLRVLGRGGGLLEPFLGQLRYVFAGQVQHDSHGHKAQHPGSAPALGGFRFLLHRHHHRGVTLVLKERESSFLPTYGPEIGGASGSFLFLYYKENGHNNSERQDGSCESR